MNLTIGFVDVRTGAHTNTIESTWHHIRHFLIPTTGWGTTSITWPTTCLRRGADPRKWTSSQISMKWLQAWTEASYPPSFPVMPPSDSQLLHYWCTFFACDITYCMATNPLRSIQVTVGYVTFSCVTHPSNPETFQYKQVPINYTSPVHTYSCRTKQCIKLFTSVTHNNTLRHLKLFGRLLPLATQPSVIT